MGRYNSLKKYLEFYEKGGFGWRLKYDKEVNLKENGYPWFSGHMGSMLDDLIKMIGTERCSRLVKEYEWIDSQGYIKQDPKTKED